MQLFVKKKLPNEKNPLTKNVLYYAIISCDDEKYKPKLYKGIIETTFKKRYANHKNSECGKNKNDTKLCTKYWKLTNEKLHSRRYWSIKNKYKSNKQNSRRSSLYFYEKLEIVGDPKELLNKRSEVISQRHY